MRDPSSKPETRPRLLDMTPEEMARSVEALGHPAYRARQLRDWLFGKSIVEPERMTNLPPGFVDHFRILTSRIIRLRRSRDRTVKLLIELEDGPAIESVMIPTGRRFTACVSTQAGCAMGCVFCASGRDGLRRNLRAGEILEQVLHLQRKTGRRITHVVFMGMGEPLANYDAVLSAVRALIDPDRFALSARHVTLSTVGIPDRIQRLSREDLPVNLAISLHAADDALRRRLIPSCAGTPIEEIAAAAETFRLSRNRRLTLEYTLLDGINDSPIQADKLARLARRLKAMVNLIRYNPVPSLPFRGPSEERMELFAERLKKSGVNAQIRRSRGADADAACGQLRMRGESPDS